MPPGSNFTSGIDTADVPHDAVMRDAAERDLHEAAERATFHAREAERWQRIGRAAGAALVQLDSHAPIREFSAEEFVAQSSPDRAANPASSIGAGQAQSY